MSFEHGPGTQITVGAVSRLRFEYVWMPEQPLKLYPTEIEVTFWFDATLKVMGTPCAVVPLHWPSSAPDEEGEGVVGLQALNEPHARRAPTRARLLIVTSQ